MTWLQGSQQTPLNKINTLMGRLIRLVTYKQLQECERRLQDRGVSCNLLQDYDVSLPVRVTPKHALNLVKVIPHEESTF